MPFLKTYALILSLLKNLCSHSKGNLNLCRPLKLDDESSVPRRHTDFHAEVPVVQRSRSTCTCTPSAFEKEGPDSHNLLCVAWCMSGKKRMTYCVISSRLQLPRCWRRIVSSASGKACATRYTRTTCTELRVEGYTHVYHASTGTGSAKSMPVENLYLHFSLGAKPTPSSGIKSMA